MGRVVLLFTVFTVHSVTDDRVSILTGEETVTVSSDDVPGCPFCPEGCSNIGSFGLDSRYNSGLD